MASVFLSYDHEDVGFARPIAVALEKAGHTVWYDRHIHLGAQYSRRIEQELDSAEAVVVLWSTHSLESAWVRDEAAEGRDREKLVPLSLGGVVAPIGFRQFQTIPLGNWNGRGKIPYLADLLRAIDSQSEAPVAPVADAKTKPSADPPTDHKIDRRWVVGGIAIFLLALAGFGAWKFLGTGGMPVVEVAAANPSPQSQAAASDLYVKLGSLAQVGQGAWKLVDTASAPAKPDYVFRTADTGASGTPQASLLLLDGRDDSLLWSREFKFPAGAGAELRQQLSLTAGRVLGCALESRSAGGLRRDLLRIFLTTCATIAEASMQTPEAIVRRLRSVVMVEPNFKPAWGRLLSADMNVVDVANNMAGDKAGAVATLRSDMEAARKVDPDLPELKIAEASLLDPTEYAKINALVSQAAKTAPGNPLILSQQASALMRVGRMFDAAAVARQAADADPLSPIAAGDAIMTLAYSGQIDNARRELAEAEKLWAGTGALRDVQWAFYYRYGDPAIAKTVADTPADWSVTYLDARANPSPATIGPLLALLRPLIGNPEPGVYGFATQALAEFNQLDTLFESIDRVPTKVAASQSYILFRPAFAAARRDRRFLALTKRIRLHDFWRQSGQWPDFCDDSALTYDCRTGAPRDGD